ncbi:hypothetical protein I2I11_00160 [Pontibacter sp. 172403-2]|uniref:hypothetical protein n=1 Tax=Pontibacter rufus TaxID=2791028 RepID=UPI0018AFD456|nr:hypothetical protein [Pontibacter sp. 172403-2]MBF9251698.1 hypothetical protein [Pontibacter sp. 172403-2]
MAKYNIKSWALFAVSILLSALAISLFIKVLKVAIFFILVLALAPVVYFILRLILRGKKRDADERTTEE